MDNVKIASELVAMAKELIAADIEMMPHLNNLKTMKLIARRVGMELDPKVKRGSLADTWDLDGPDYYVEVIFDADGVVIEKFMDEDPHTSVGLLNKTGNVEMRDVEKMLRKLARR